MNGVDLSKLTIGFEQSRLRTIRGLPRRKLMLGIGRRKFISFLGGAAAWPVGARAQQARHVPIIGYVAPTNPLIPSRSTGAFLQRLRELKRFPIILKHSPHA